MAVLTALNSGFPISRGPASGLKGNGDPEARNSSGRTIELAGPRGPVSAAASRALFRWQADFQVSEWRLVLLSAEHRELAWSSPQAGTSYRPEGWFKEILNRPGRYFWCVVGTKGGSQLRSGLVEIQVR